MHVPTEVTDAVHRPKPYATEPPPWRRAPKPERRVSSACVVCGTQIPGLVSERRATCRRSVARCWYQALATDAGAVLPDSPVPLITRRTPQEPSEGPLQGHGPPMALYPLSLADIAAQATQGRVAA